MIMHRKKEAARCSLDGAVTAPFKLDQNNYLTQFILQTLFRQPDFMAVRTLLCSMNITRV